MNKYGKLNKKHKTIRVLESKAKKNDINALFQLAQYYESGQYVEEDIEQAKIYFDKVLELFKSQSLKISSLKLVNFRAFNNIKINFSNKYNPNLTVIVGNNGAGKTALLESIEKNLSWIYRKIVSQGGTGDSIDQIDINNDSTAEYASIISDFSISEKIHYKLELSKSKESNKATRKGQYQEITNLASIYKLANSRNAQFNFPVMASYFVVRALEISKKDTEGFDELTEKKYWTKFDGYQKALNGAADFKLFFRWFKYFDDVDNASDKNNLELMNEISNLKAELESVVVKEMEKQVGVDNNITQFLCVFKQEKQKKIQKLEAEMHDKSKVQPNDVVYGVTKAIYKFLPDFNNLRIQRSPSLDMLVDKNNVTLSILQLSQGEKSLLALVADIARRLVLLNPSLDEPLDGNGIVLIDEIDLHLHPEWQQSVIPNLLTTFPNIQFIVTTHSPQVVTTVDDECLRILENGEIYSAPKGSKGAKSSRMLKRIFGVDVRPPNDSNTQDLAEYKSLVYNNKWECSRAKELRLKLDKQFGDEEPDLTELDLYIENREWELEIEKDQ